WCCGVRWWYLKRCFRTPLTQSSRSCLMPAQQKAGRVWPNGCNRVWLQAVVATVPVRCRSKVHRKSRPSKRSNGNKFLFGCNFKNRHEHDGFFTHGHKKICRKLNQKRHSKQQSATISSVSK